MHDRHKIHTFSANEWVQKELEERLKAKGLFERYIKEKFASKLM